MQPRPPRLLWRETASFVASLVTVAKLIVGIALAVWAIATLIDGFRFLNIWPLLATVPAGARHAAGW